MLDIAEEAPDKIAALRRSAKDGDLKAYRITAHSIKGLMATIGAADLSEKAKLHETAAANSDTGFIFAHSEELIEAYEQLTTKIMNALNQR